MTVPRLTPEQISIIELVAEGSTDKAIAEALGLSVSTVQRRLMAAGRVLGTRTRVGIAMKATTLGLISGPGTTSLGEPEPEGPRD